MYTLRNFRTFFIAVAAILAMLIVPACGSLCAAMTHCSASTASAGNESCHHADMSAQSDSEASSLSSLASCGQQTPLFATLTNSESSLQLEFASAANALFSTDLQSYAAVLNSHRLDFLPSEISPQQSIPLENLSVLRV